AGTTVWRPLPSQAHPELLAVVRPDRLPLVGLALAVSLGLAAVWFAKRLSERSARRLLLLWLALGGLALVWLPAPWRPVAWWPALAGAAAALVWFVSLGLGRLPTARGGSPSTVITSTIALICLFGIPGQAAAPEPTTVYLLPESDGKIQ